MTEFHTTPDACVGCDDGAPLWECASSHSSCGHHCNHTWYGDPCCWCGVRVSTVSPNKTDIPERAGVTVEMRVHEGMWVDVSARVTEVRFGPARIIPSQNTGVGGAW